MGTTGGVEFYRHDSRSKVLDPKFLRQGGAFIDHGEVVVGVSILLHRLRQPRALTDHGEVVVDVSTFLHRLRQPKALTDHGEVVVDVSMLLHRLRQALRDGER